MCHLLPIRKITVDAVALYVGLSLPTLPSRQGAEPFPRLKDGGRGADNEQVGTLEAHLGTCHATLVFIPLLFSANFCMWRVMQWSSIFVIQPSSNFFIIIRIPK